MAAKAFCSLSGISVQRATLWRRSWGRSREVCRPGEDGGDDFLVLLCTGWAVGDTYTALPDLGHSMEESTGLECHLDWGVGDGPDYPLYIVRDQT